MTPVSAFPLTDWLFQVNLFRSAQTTPGRAGSLA